MRLPDEFKLGGAHSILGPGGEVLADSSLAGPGAVRLEPGRLYRRARSLQNSDDFRDVDLARQIYRTLLERHAGTSWAKSARRQLDILEGEGSLSDQVEFRGRRIFIGITQPDMLLATMVAPMAFQVGRVGGLASLLRSPGKVARFLGRPWVEAMAYGAGFLAETTAFSSVHYGAGRYLGKSEAELGSFASSWIHGTWMLGGMKAMGLAGNLARRHFHGIDALGRVTRYQHLAPWTARVLPELSGVLGGMAGIGLQNFGELGFSQDGWGLLEGALEMHLSFKGMAGVLGAMPHSWRRLETELHHQAQLLGEGQLIAQVRRLSESWKRSTAVPTWRAPLVFAMEGGGDGPGSEGPPGGEPDNLVFFPPPSPWRQPKPTTESPSASEEAPPVLPQGGRFLGSKEPQITPAANRSNVIPFPTVSKGRPLRVRRVENPDLRPVVRECVFDAQNQVTGLVLASGVRATDIKQLFGELPQLKMLYFRDPIAFEAFREIMALKEMRRVEHLNVDRLFYQWPQARRRKVLRILAKNSHLSGLRSLSLQGVDLKAHELEILTQGSQLSGVTHLNLGDNPQLGSRGIEVLARASTFYKLSHLVLQNTGVGDVGLRALMMRHCKPRLTHLELQVNAITLFGLWTLSRSSQASSLVFLDISGNGLGPGTGKLFAEGSVFSKLRHLNLSRVGRADEDSTDFRGSSLRDEDKKNWESLGREVTAQWELGQDFRPRRPLSSAEESYLESLEAEKARRASSEEEDWGIAQLSVSDMEALANSEALSGLQSLVLAGNELNPQHWGALLRGSRLQPRVLDLSDNLLMNLQNSEGAPRLFQSSLGQRLEELSLRENLLFQGDLDFLFSAPPSYPVRLHTLELAGNPYLRNDGIREISSGRFPLLSVLDLQHCGLTDAGARSLLTQLDLSQFSALYVGGNQIPDFLLRRLDAEMSSGKLFREWRPEWV